MNTEEKQPDMAPPPVGDARARPAAPLEEATDPLKSSWLGRRLNDPRRKSSAMATLLSLMPGLGQIYVGYYTRGFVHIFVVATLITLLANDPGPLTPFLGLGLAFFWMYNMVDAGRRAMFYNQVLHGGGSPEDIQLPGNRGSLVGGAVLIAGGALLLLHTRFRWDMYWVEEWWPLGLILMGGYLVWKDRQGRKSAD